MYALVTNLTDADATIGPVPSSDLFEDTVISAGETVELPMLVALSLPHGTFGVVYQTPPAAEVTEVDIAEAAAVEEVARYGQPYIEVPAGDFTVVADYTTPEVTAEYVEAVTTPETVMVASAEEVGVTLVDGTSYTWGTEPIEVLAPHAAQLLADYPELFTEVTQ